MNKNKGRLKQWALYIFLGIVICGATMGARWLRDHSREAQCRQSLEAIFSACQLYRDNNGGEWPKSLTELGFSERILQCPVSKQPYIYHAPSGLKREPVILHQSSDTDHGNLVLWSDGAVLKPLTKP